MNTSAIFELFLKYRKVTTDTRNIEKNSIFFALKGANFNGNLFANQAIEQGAIAAIVDEKEFENVSKNIYFVPNTLESLQDLARNYRNHLEIPFIGLTGSNGKTTTKELIGPSHRYGQSTSYRSSEVRLLFRTRAYVQVSLLLLFHCNELVLLHRLTL